MVRVADFPINSTARTLARDTIIWMALCMVAAQLRTGDYIPLPLPIGVAIERLAPEIVEQRSLGEQHESAYRLAGLLCQMARVHRCPCCPHFLDGLHACKQPQPMSLLTQLLQAGRVVCSAGHYRDLDDAEDIAVPAEDLRAFEQLLLAVQSLLQGVQGQVPVEFEMPVFLCDTAGDPAQTVQALLRSDSQGLWTLFHDSTGQECAVVLVSNHAGQIELKAWMLPEVDSDAPITSIRIDDLTVLTRNTEANHHVG